jgi:gas vesicle protein
MGRHHGRDFILGAVLGSSLGALTAVMMGSKKGHKIQKEMVNKYREFEKMVKGYAKKQEKNVKRVVRKAKSKARAAKRKLSK